MSEIQVQLMLNDVTLDQLHDELGKLKFAGYGKSKVHFNGIPSVRISATKHTPTPSPTAPKRKTS